MKLRILALTVISLTFQYSFAQITYATGANFDDDAYGKLEVTEPSFGFGGSLPEAYSLEKYMPSVRSQGSYGTCTGWSSTYYAATMEYAILNDLTDQFIINAYAFDPYYTYLNTTSDNDYFDCQAGAYTGAACQTVVDFGVKRFNYNELTCGSYVSERNSPKNSTVNFKEVIKIFDPEELEFEENISNIKLAISEKHPVVLGMRVPKALYKPNENGLMVCSEDEETDGGHAMTVVAYDDNKFGGCFKVANSWGKNYGDNGFVYITYEDFFKYTKYAFRYETSLKEMRSKEGCIYGNCWDGYGIYVFNDSIRYEGDFVEASLSGYGILFMGHDDYYKGEYEDGTRNGLGDYQNRRFGSIHNGYWYKDNAVEDTVVLNKYTKEGIISHIMEQQIVKGSIENLYKALERESFLDNLEALPFDGCIYGDCENGFGMFVVNKNSESKYVYLGAFSFGLRAPYGHYIGLGDDRGHSYQGEFEYGMRHGTGTYTFPNGDKYYGNWSYGKRQGFGTMQLADGDHYSGNWVYGKFDSDDLGFGEVNTGTPLMMHEKTQVKDVSIPATPQLKVKPQKKK